MRGGESFSGQVRNPVTELLRMRCDEAALLTIEAVENRKVGVVAVTLMGEVWEL